MARMGTTVSDEQFLAFAEDEEDEVAGGNKGSVAKAPSGQGVRATGGSGIRGPGPGPVSGCGLFVGDEASSILLLSLCLCVCLSKVATCVVCLKRVCVVWCADVDVDTDVAVCVLEGRRRNGLCALFAVCLPDFRRGSGLFYC